MARTWTTAFEATRKLHELLDARTDLGDATVWRGYPGEQAGPEIVWIGGLENVSQQTQSLGQRARDESYVVPVYIDVAMNTGNPADVWDRIEALFHIVEEVVHDNVRLGGVVNKWAEIDGAPDTVVEAQPISDTAFAGVVRVDVACQSRT